MKFSKNNTTDNEIGATIKTVFPTAFNFNVTLYLNI
jgi:hypothetical protein